MDFSNKTIITYDEDNDFINVRSTLIEDYGQFIHMFLFKPVDSTKLTIKSTPFNSERQWIYLQYTNFTDEARFLSFPLLQLTYYNEITHRKRHEEINMSAFVHYVRKIRNMDKYSKYHKPHIAGTKELQWFGEAIYSLLSFDDFAQADSRMTSLINLIDNVHQRICMIEVTGPVEHWHGQDKE